MLYLGHANDCLCTVHYVPVCKTMGAKNSMRFHMNIHLKLMMFSIVLFSALLQICKES